MSVYLMGSVTHKILRLVTPYSRNCDDPTNELRVRNPLHKNMDDLTYYLIRFIVNHIEPRSRETGQKTQSVFVMLFYLFH